MSRQLTIALLKPDIAALPHVVKRVEKAIIKKDLLLLDRKRFEPSQATENLISKFYAEHEGKFFHRRCVEYMQSGPFEAWVLAGPNAINDWRELIGKARIFEENWAEKSTLRTNFGVTDTRNGFHGSDSVKAVVEEMQKLGFSYNEFEEELSKERDYVFEPAFNVHKAVLPSGFYADVSETLGLKSTWDRVYTDSENAPKEWFSTSYLDNVVHTWLAQDIERSNNSLYKDDEWNEEENSEEEKLTGDKIDTEIKPLKIVDIGCGLSNFSQNIASTFENKVDIIATDFSKPLINSRQESNKLENINFKLCDLVNDNLPQKLEINKADIILDKATIDAIVRQPNGEIHAKSVMSKLMKLLPKMIICVSDEGPEVRTEFLESLIPKSGIRISSIICENISEEIDSNSYGQYFAYKIQLEYSKRYRRQVELENKSIENNLQNVEQNKQQNEQPKEQQSEQNTVKTS